MMTTTYRSREMTRDGVPFPIPSRAPEEVKETAETINPRLIRCRAVTPMEMVVSFAVKRPNSCAGISQQRAVPTAMIAADRISAV